MSTLKTKVEEPYAVKTVLKENSAVNPDAGTGIYVRYTELIAADDAPEIFKNVITECNSRAEKAALKRLQSVPSELSADVLQEKMKDYRFEAYAYIVTVTRADLTALSILETEYEADQWDGYKGKNVSYQFRGSTFDMTEEMEIPLSELTADHEALSKMLEDALQTQYETTGLAATEPSDYAWTADALGIRFYFNSDAVSKEKRREIGDYWDDVITVAFPYDMLDGVVVRKLSDVPEDYIARLDRETVYDLPYGDLSIMLTENDEKTFIRMIPDQGQETSLSIEYADHDSDFYIIRSQGGFYLFREDVDAQEGFFYDFSWPDGGYGRFAYNISQYFDSFMREIGLALPYNPHCVHMCEVKRSFGNASSLVPNGHYSFPDNTERKYKRFVLIDDVLQIDTRNTACRLLEDLSAVELDEQGRELHDITVEAGTSIFFESVLGEAERYQIPPKSGRPKDGYVYDCRLTDGRRIRFSSNFETLIYVKGIALNRISEPISLAEAQIAITPPEEEVFTVRIGNKDYPVIPDYTKSEHFGEEIDFGDDIWWQAEGYVGLYELSDEDRSSNALLMIRKNGTVRLDYSGVVYEGRMPDKRCYGEYVVLDLKSQSGEYRSFDIVPRDGQVHDIPSKIELYSRGLPATNEPSKQPPITIYLTKSDKDIPEQYDYAEEAETVKETDDLAEEVICSGCGTKVINARFCSECGAPLNKKKN